MFTYDTIGWRAEDGELDLLRFAQLFVLVNTVWQIVAVVTGIVKSPVLNREINVENGFSDARGRRHDKVECPGDAFMHMHNGETGFLAEGRRQVLRTKAQLVKHSVMPQRNLQWIRRPAHRYRIDCPAYRRDRRAANVLHTPADSRKIQQPSAGALPHTRSAWCCVPRRSADLTMNKATSNLIWNSYEVIKWEKQQNEAARKIIKAGREKTFRYSFIFLFFLSAEKLENLNQICNKTTEIIPLGIILQDCFLIINLFQLHFMGVYGRRLIPLSMAIARN